MVRAPAVQGGPKQLSGPVRGRGERGEDAQRQPLQAAGLGHLHHRRLAAQRVRGSDLVAERPGDPYLTPLEPGRDRCVHRAVAAVGHRQCLDLDARRDPVQPGRHPLRDLHGRERALELVRGDEHPLGTPPAPVHCSVRHLYSPCSPGLDLCKAVAPL